MRRLGIGLLGFIGGLLFALVAFDLLAPLLPWSARRAGGQVLGGALPLMGVLGCGIALYLDRRQRRP